MYLVFTCMPGESYCWQHWVLLLYLCDVFQAPIISLGCWFDRNCHLLHQACVLLLHHIFNLTFSLPTYLCSVFRKEFHRQVVPMMVYLLVMVYSIFKLRWREGGGGTFLIWASQQIVCTWDWMLKLHCSFKSMFFSFSPVPWTEHDIRVSVLTGERWRHVCDVLGNCVGR